MGDQFVDSYDPRRWAAAWTPRQALEGRAARRSASRQRLGSVGLGAGILLAGAAAAWIARPDAMTPRPGVAADAPPGAGEAQSVRRTLQLASAAELETALRRFGLDAATAAQVAAQARPALGAEGEVRAVLEMTREGGALRFYRLQASNPDSSGAVVRRGEGGALETSRLAAEMRERIVVMHGIMDGDSFYSSAVGVGVPNALISPFAKALAFDFDFQRDVVAGDAFELAYAQRTNAAGEAMGSPLLLYASMTTQTKSAAVYRFQQPGGEVEWYDASGRTVARSLMRTPVDGARVSSKFGFRIHPVLKYRKLHGGIDFAAPTGTPIYASGAGVVEFCGPKGANGNFTKIRHDNGWETLYLHQNRFAPGIAVGVRVAQGQQIGEVGTTGRSTGPHLHYEVHINGERVDPATVQPDPSESKSLTGAQMQAFEQVRDRIDVNRAQGSS
ncbi:M23 family metallopeptidase [Novosphingobium soli]|uniref:M23 family metallopeptidase n=1 Tax=Novosphingobium soli TaxID=574956 RepID=A0ABV6D1Y2_9SPHN